MITKSRQRHVIGYATSTWLAAPPTLPGTVRVSMSLEDLAWLIFIVLLVGCVIAAVVRWK